ncbi:low specificity L-threonine aldolase [Paenibacillus sp. 1011MAR3C5]|uniref:threonine aldolase family protein n=1 Tax=Paenibacillus sp. 1011MAR3C5 TaxID=1675787 RepID=UPI000E6D0200|nr:beta-eliminating lyase-related protein [Paenibacillus sp. 1011MAR3C5]RJE88456.1 low specificity L-threonine aldolase [Paenibacillus sp. 1011MAR3C5]
MEKTITLFTAYNQSSYPLIGHGKRNAQVLKEAFANIDDSLNGDMYGSGKVIEQFQDRMAKLLGKEAAVFFPSGTMAQQIALRLWSDEKGSKKIAYHPLSHLEIHEEDGLKELHHLEPILLADESRPVLLRDLQALSEGVSAVLLELPQREIGGQLPEYEELEAMSAYCRQRGIKLHLDGARLFEVLPYYGKSAEEVCALFDSVYISVYKGIGGIAGAVLAGERGFIQQSKVWKRRHGGDLISLYPYIVAADYYMEQRLPLMAQYYRDAVELAGYYRTCGVLRVRPEVPVSNMFHVHSDLQKTQLEAAFIRVAQETGIGLCSTIREHKAGGVYFEVSIGDRYADVPKTKLEEAFRVLNEALKDEGSESRE